MDKKGVIDRIEDEKYAVILVETEGSEYVVLKDRLPEGAKEGSWLKFTVVKQEITQMKLEQHQTDVAHRNAKDQLNRIRKKSKGSKYKR